MPTYNWEPILHGLQTEIFMTPGLLLRFPNCSHAPVALSNPFSTGRIIILKHRPDYASFLLK